MKFNRLCSMALAATIAIGVMASGMTAFADGNSTTVTLTVAEPENVYTMTIPAATTMDAAGAATALVNGLNVTGTNMTKNVVVTMTAADEWTMTAQGVQTTIGYAVYESESSETALTEVEFDKTAIMASTGSTKALYVKPAAADLEAAEPGTYTGTITFGAELKAAASMEAQVADKVTEVWENLKNNLGFSLAHNSQPKTSFAQVVAGYTFTDFGGGIYIFEMDDGDSVREYAVFVTDGTVIRVEASENSSEGYEVDIYRADQPVAP